MDKYYTPEIEEFHVGFEYRLQAGVRKLIENNQPEGVVEMSAKMYDMVYDGHSIDTLMYGLGFKDCVQVKYLDREDIESLGFEHKLGVGHGDVAGMNYVRSKFVKEKITIFLFSPVPKDLIKGDENSQGYVIPYTLEIEIEYKGYVFKGIIKNKSELKKVLKMIGYGD